MGKNTIEAPENYMLLLIALCFVFVVWIFLFSGGRSFFDSWEKGIPVSTGLLTFVSIFFGFMVNGLEDYMKCRNKRIDCYEDAFSKEREEVKIIESDEERRLAIKDYNKRYRPLREYKWFVNPLLWFYFSVVCSLLTLGINFAEFPHKILIVSFFVHLSFLASLLLISSVMAFHISYLMGKD